MGVKSERLLLKPNKKLFTPVKQAWNESHKRLHLDIKGPPISADGVSTAGSETTRASTGNPAANNCIVHVQALSGGRPEYYSELLPSRCPLLLCLYGELLIVWQDWQAPLQSWLKALRSEKWDRYRANTCPLAVLESPTGCALHWHRINGSIKTPT